MIWKLSIPFVTYIDHILSRSIIFFWDMPYSKSRLLRVFFPMINLSCKISDHIFFSTIIPKRRWWWFQEKGCLSLRCTNYNNPSLCMYVYWADNMFMLKCCSHVCPTLVLIDDVTTEEEEENVKFLFLYCWDVGDDALNEQNVTCFERYF